MSAVSKRFTPASMQISMRRRASSTCTLPIAAKRPSPPRVIVPKLSAEPSRPLAPRILYSIVALLLPGYPTAGIKPKKSCDQPRGWNAPARDGIPAYKGRQRLSGAGVDVAVRRSLPDVGGQHLRRTYIIAQHFDAKNDLQVPLLPAVWKCAQHRLQQVATRQKFSHSEGPEMIQSGSHEERVAGLGVKHPGHHRAIFGTARFPRGRLPAEELARAPVANPVHRALGFEDEARVLRQVQRPPVGESADQ